MLFNPLYLAALITFYGDFPGKTWSNHRVGSGDRAGYPLIKRSTFQFPSPLVCKSKWLWARYWIPNCSQCLTSNVWEQVGTLHGSFCSERVCEWVNVTCIVKHFQFKLPSYARLLIFTNVKDLNCFELLVKIYCVKSLIKLLFFVYYGITLLFKSSVLYSYLRKHQKPIYILCFDSFIVVLISLTEYHSLSI